MIVEKRIELRRGHKLKEVVGTIPVRGPIVGKAMVFLAMSMLKQPYSRKAEMIEVPIAYDVYYDDGIEWRVKRILNVSKKSKRQIELIKCNYL